MHIILTLLLLFSIFIGPQLWIRWVFYKYSRDLADIPGSGSELAVHLAEKFEIVDLDVEETQPNKDHFDSSAPAVRLSPSNFHGRSLTAVAVAAHEVGHAIQWHRNETVFQLRSRYIPLAVRLQRIGIGLMSIAPFVGLLTRHPVGIGLPIVGGIVVAVCGAATYLIVLPEEWDASFNKAMPILIDGNYITEEQQPAVKRILRAAALTYAAAALASILQIWRWLPFILRR